MSKRGRYEEDDDEEDCEDDEEDCVDDEEDCEDDDDDDGENHGSQFAADAAPPPQDYYADDKRVLEQFDMQTIRSDFNVVREVTRDDNSWPEEKLKSIFHALCRKWCVSDDADDAPESDHDTDAPGRDATRRHNTTLDKLMRNSFGKDPDDPHTDLNSVRELHKKHKYLAGTLFTMMNIRGLITDEIQASFDRMLKVMTNVADACRIHTETGMLTNKFRLITSTQIGELDMANFCRFDPEEQAREKLKTVYEHVLRSMREHGVRRKGDDVYGMIYIKAPQRVEVTGLDGKAHLYRSLHAASSEIAGQMADAKALHEEDPSRAALYEYVVETLSFSLTKDEAVLFEGYRVKWEGLPEEALEYPTFAWKKLMTIEDWVYDTVRKEFDYTMYSYMRSAGNYARFVISWLQSSKEYEFEDLKINRRLFAFRGDPNTGRGMVIYDLAHAVYPLDDRSCWEENAKKANAQWAKRIGDAEMRPHASPPDPHDAVVKLFDHAFCEEWVTFDVFDEPSNSFVLQCADELSVPVKYRPSDTCDWSEYPDIRALGDEPNAPNADAILDALRDGPPEGAKFEVALGAISEDALWDFKWKRIESMIEAYDFSTILSTQQLDTRSRCIVYAQMGRCLYYIHELDKLEQFPLVFGPAGTGKSTLLHEHAQFFAEGAVGVLNAPIEQAFPLASVFDKDVIHMPEVGGRQNSRGNQMLDENLFKACISADRVCINQKHKPQHFMKWRAPFFAAGNAHMEYKNEGGSYERRLVCIPFSLKPRGMDTHMPGRLAKRRANLLARMNIAYLMTLLWYKSRTHLELDADGVPLCGQSIYKATRDAVSQMDPVHRFLSESDIWTMADPGAMWPESEFLQEFNTFRRERGIDMSIGWKEETYASAFNRFKLKMVQGQTWTDPRDPSVTKVCTCIRGIARKM